MRELTRSTRLRSWTSGTLDGEGLHQLGHNLALFSGEGAVGGSRVQTASQAAQVERAAPSTRASF